MKDKNDDIFKEKYSTLWVRMKEDTHKRLKLLARERGKTTAFIVRKILEKYFAERPIV